MSKTVYTSYGLSDSVKITFERKPFSKLKDSIEGVIVRIDVKREYLDIKDSERNCLLKISPYAIKKI